MRMALGLGLGARRKGTSAPPTPSAPTILGVPSISGTGEVGQTLTASPASVIGYPSPTRTWQWLRNGVDIAGATSSTYLLVTADGGTDVSVEQTETNVQGTDSAVSVSIAVDAPPASVITFDSIAVSIDSTALTFDME